MYTLDVTDLHIEHKTQFFFDNLIVESLQDLTRRLHRPRRVEGGPLLTADRPWETVSYFSCATWNALWDARERLFKCWYTDWHFDPKEFYDRVPSPEGLHDFNRVSFRMLYACSPDGIHWTKPALGLVQEGGHDTNIVLGGAEFGTVYCFHVFEDPFEGDPEHRFKTLYGHIMPQGRPGDAAKLPLLEVRIAHSPDGVHWTTWKERPTSGQRGEPPLFDDIWIMTPDLDSQQYVATTRHLYRSDAAPNPRTPRTSSFIRPHYPEDVGRDVRRRIWFTESGDLVHWVEPYLVLRPDDDEDNVDDGFYGMAYMNLGSHRIGLLNLLQSVDNTMDVQLVYSRDGKRWRRAGQRQAFLERGAPGSWDATMVTCPSIPIRMGDELWIYYSGARNHHDWWMFAREEGLDVPEARDLNEVRYGMGLAKLRADGFVSMDAGSAREGLLATRPFISDGTRLVINAACGPGGYVDVEVVDPSDEVLPGCSRAECDTFRGDSVQHVVTWAGREEVPYSTAASGAVDYARRLGYLHLRAPHRKLRFYLRNASLYSFRLERPGEGMDSGS